MPWPTMNQALFGYVSSQMTLEIVMNAVMNIRWFDEPHAAG